MSHRRRCPARLAKRWKLPLKGAIRPAGRIGRPRALQPLTPSLDQAGGLQRLVLRGHAGPVTRVLLAPSGTDAITASSDGTCRVWDLEIGDCVLVLEGHAGRVNAVAMDPLGRFVVTAGKDGTARVWDLSSGKAIHVLQTGGPPAQGEQEGPRAILLSREGGARAQRPRECVMLSHRPSPTLATSAGGALCVALSACTRFVLVGGAGNIAQMFDVITGQQVGALAGHTNCLVAVRFSRSGRKAVTASHDGTARVWDLQKGTCRHVLEGHKARLNAVTLSADGKLAATASDDGTARLWDVRTGACRKVLMVRCGEGAGGHPRRDVGFL